MQLTWMDAKLGDWVITPRHGKPVEINALWFNALMCMAKFSRMLDKEARVFETLAAQTRAGFSRFLKPDGGLYDVLDGPAGDDASVRPNQILAVSLTHSPLAPHAQARVVAEVRQYLLTSYGLRSLAQDIPATVPAMQAMYGSAIPRIIRERSGPGCCLIMHWRNTGLRATPCWPNPGLRLSVITCWMRDWVRYRKSSMANRLMQRGALRRRHGA